MGIEEIRFQVNQGANSPVAGRTVYPVSGTHQWVSRSKNFTIEVEDVSGQIPRTRVHSNILRPTTHEAEVFVKNLRDINSI
jgi:hypothetical protein